jgi:hypothetical protein
MHRFKIVFNNSQQYNNLGTLNSSRQPNLMVSGNRNISLHSPIIDLILAFIFYCSNIYFSSFFS